jgi:hypothetical protein
LKKRDEVDCSASFNCALDCVCGERRRNASAQTAVPDNCLRHAGLFRSGKQAGTARTEANAGVDANGGAVVKRKPQGCPHAFRGCEDSPYVFGKIRPELNLASNWIRKFARTSPAPEMAAARSNHVMVLMSYVEGNNWAIPAAA